MSDTTISVHVANDFGVLTRSERNRQPWAIYFFDRKRRYGLNDDKKWIVKHSTSIDENLTQRGYKKYTTDSPANDTSYTPNSAAPD